MAGKKATNKADKAKAKKQVQVKDLDTKKNPKGGPNMALFMPSIG